MKQVLYIDYIEQKGHVNFHRIHIDALKNEGYNVKIILHENIARQLPYSDKDYLFTLPSCLHQRDNQPMLNRLVFLLTLLYTKSHVNFNLFNHVIVASLDEITLGILPLCRNMKIICHGNGKSFSNPIKRFFMKKLSKNNSFVVFNEYMAQPYKERGYHNVYIISHGCSFPFPKLEENLPINLDQYKKIIFHPSNKINVDFLNELNNNSQISSYLEDNSILILLRNVPDSLLKSSHIKSINTYLSQMQYQSLFVKADIILLAYPASFNHQVSGVSYECIANKKRMLCLQHSSLEYARDFYNYNIFFKNVQEFKDRLTSLLKEDRSQCIENAASLQPNYSFLKEI